MPPLIFVVFYFMMGARLKQSIEDLRKDGIAVDIDELLESDFSDIVKLTDPMNGKKSSI